MPVEHFFIDKPEHSESCPHPTICQNMRTVLTADGTRLFWSNPDPTSKLPELGSEVTIKMNNFGKVVVIGYFSSNEFVGVMGIPLNPPEFFKKNIAIDRKTPGTTPWRKAGVACFFGIDIGN